MKALIDKYSTYFILALVLVFGISAYLLWVRSKGNAFARYAYSPADKEAFDKIIAWIKINNPNEYSWWRNNIQLYMPGAPRGNMFGLSDGDMPDGSTSLTKRVMAAASELPWSDTIAQGAATVYNTAANAYYNQFLNTVQWVS